MDIYSGGIGAILTGLLNGMDNFSQFSDLVFCKKKMVNVLYVKENLKN